MTKNEVATVHHYVPRFLLSRWETVGATGQRGITGYYWNGHLKCLHRGAKYFGQQEHLLSLEALGGKAPDVVETAFFARIDNAGARAIDLVRGERTLSWDQTFDLAALLLSMETRRPNLIKLVRERAAERYSAAAAGSPILKAAAEAAGLSLASHYHKVMGHPLKDRFLLTMLEITLSPANLELLMAASWAVLGLPLSAPTLLLSDRPVIRDLSTRTGEMMWALPLSPRMVLVGASNHHDLQGLNSVDPVKAVALLNRGSVAQCDKYVFGVPGLDRDLLSAEMETRASAGYIDHTLNALEEALKAK